MNGFPFPFPEPPLWRVDWDALDAEYSWIRAMRGCEQDAVYHAEGDVWIHVRMVCEAMAALGAWRELPQAEREILFAAALLHDQAKPSCTRMEGGRITSRGHSVRGAIDARRIQWEMGVAFAAREQVCALIRFHQSPFHLIHREDSQRLAFLISQTTRCDLLAILARADMLGRQCADQQSILERIALFEEYCLEQQCLHGPRQFPSAHSRFEYFRADNRDHNSLAHEEFRCDVILMSGLPATGKDTWIAHWMPNCAVISLDSIREELGKAATGKQGAVVSAARERARELLRERKDFVWNATNLSREIRGQLIDLFTNYQAHIRIVYVESAMNDLYTRNHAREAAVPAGAIREMMDRWELPSPVEAQAVEWWIDGKRILL